jgi:sortase A
MLYRYVKAPIAVVAEEQPAEILPATPRQKITLNPKVRRYMPSILMTLGSLLIANVAWPIISHELIYGPQIRREPILSPLQEDSLIQVVGQKPTTSESGTSTNTPQVMGANVDYTNAHNWFPTANYNVNASGFDVPVYKISIPAVNVEDAIVTIGGEDLSKGLIHFPGTSLPGQLGSPVIFGHSMLRQFYSPQKNNKDRYLSIFSKIMTLKEDDQIFIDYDGIRYTYNVKEKVEVKPEDVFILQQRLNNRELKLITCTPEGTYLRRGVIVAQLADVY